MGRILRLRGENHAAPLRMLRHIWNCCSLPGLLRQAAAERHRGHRADWSRRVEGSAGEHGCAGSRV
jgi:hypothetical protein